MINPVNLPLVEDTRELVVDVAGTLEVAADRLLDDQSSERAHGAFDSGGSCPPFRFDDEPSLLQLFDRGREERRRNGEVVDPIAGQSALVLDDVEPRAERRDPALLIELHVDREQVFRERLPRRLVDRASRKPRDAVARERAVLVVAGRHAAAPTMAMRGGSTPSTWRL